MRSEVRDQLGKAILPAAFQAQFPVWEELSTEARTAKIAIARDELLKPLARAGYEVRKRGTT